MAKKLYHFEIGFPKGLNTKFGVLELNYTRHALNAANNDRYGRVNLPRKINTDNAKTIEVEVTDNYVTKIVYRIHYNDRYDLCVVVGVECRVYTVWMNERNDGHRTLNRTKYDKP